MATPPLGSLGWIDLTVPDAESLRDFYREVVGWQSEGVDCGGFHDYSMIGAEGKPVAGVCHARGVNAMLPPVWIPYFVVADVERATTTAVARGATVISPPRAFPDGSRCAVVRDPVGAVCALYQAAPSA